MIDAIGAVGTVGAALAPREASAVSAASVANASAPSVPASAASGASASSDARAAGAPGSKEARVHRAALEFESMLVRQLLSSTKVAGKDGAYSGMAVDALANGVESGGGLGLAKQIEQALSHMRPEEKK